MDKTKKKLAEHTTQQEASIDYSEVYKTQELKQLNKRLRKTKMALFICSITVFGGALVFWIMPETSFAAKDFFIYSTLSATLLMLGVLSNKYPYYSIVAALVICIGFWAIEIIIKNSDDLLIEGSIQKLIIISLLVISLHTSKEAELIRKELRFS